MRPLTHIFKTGTRVILLTAALLIMQAPTVKAQDFTTGLIGHWKLDETSGTNAANSVGSIVGALSGGLSATTDSKAGPVDRALEFNGTSDYVGLGNNAETRPDNITLALWFKSSGCAGAACDMFRLATFGYALELLNSGKVRGFVFDSGPVQFDADSPLTYNDNQWHHAVITYDDTDLKLYLDGALVKTTAATGLVYGSGDAAIGRNGNFSGNYFPGSIDDVRLYDRPLTADDIAALHDARAPGGIRYEKNSEALKYHDGYEWVHGGLGSYKPSAVYFDGTNDYLSTSTILEAASTAVGSLWFRRMGDFGSSTRFLEANSSNFVLRFDTSNRLAVQFKGVGFSIIINCNSGATTFADMNWHHLMFSVNTANTPALRVYLDDSTTFTCNTTLNEAIAFANSFNFGADWGGPTPWHGEIADFWLEIGTDLDLTVAGNRAKFISPTGQPMYLGPDGSLPLRHPPDIFLSGDTENWHINKGTAGGFTETGALTDALSAPFNRTWDSASVVETKVIASDGVADDYFGAGFDSAGSNAMDSVDIHKNTVVVGAYKHDDGASNAGAVYIYNAVTGAQMGEIFAPSPSANNEFGTSLGIDERYIAVTGGSCNGNIYVYDARSFAYLRTISTGIGGCPDIETVDIDNGKIVVGGPNAVGNSDSVRVFDAASGTLLHTLTPTDTAGMSRFGDAVAISGNWVIAGDENANSNAGEAFLFNLATCGASCNETYALTASDAAANDVYGGGVAIDGDFALVGARGNFSNTGAIYVYNTQTGTELRIINDPAGTNFSGLSWRMDIEGNIIVSGQARQNANSTSEGGQIKVYDAITGADLDSIYASDLANFDRYGGTVAMSGDKIAIGSSGDDDNGNQSGSVYIYAMTPCASPAGHTGDIIYNDDDKVMQYCNGRDWVAMGPVGGTGGGGCASPVGSAGDMVFNSAYRTMQFCNSEDWVGIGRQDTLSVGLIGHWKLDEKSGTAISDVFGLNGGTFNGEAAVVTSQGAINTALSFDGTDDYVALGTATNLNFTAADTYTLTAWFRTTEDEGVIVAFRNSADDLPMIDIGVGYLGSTTNAGRLKGLTRSANGAPVLTSAATVNDGLWHHAALSRINANTAELFLDGVSQGTITNAVIAGPVVTNLRNIGREGRWAQVVFGTADQRFLNGDVDDVRIYNRALNATEILQLYQKGN